MTKGGNSKLKRLARERQERTGQPYTVALRAVQGEREIPCPRNCGPLAVQTFHEHWATTDGAPRADCGVLRSCDHCGYSENAALVDCPEYAPEPAP